MSTVVTRHEAVSAPRRGGFRRNPALGSSLLVIMTVVLANAVFLTGLRTNNPMVYYSGLASPSPGSLHGGWTIDPNVGWTVESLGRAAAHQWASGHVPLWNSYEGLGQPLAGEMQSAAFFQPFIMLQLLPHGVFAMHLVLEVIAGLATLFFLRHLRLGWVASCVGGCLFAVNGAFAVMTNAPFNPIAFLPMGLLGVEMIRTRVLTHRRTWSGVVVLALAIAWMLLAGFPETAFLEGLFIGCWALVRVVQARDRRVAFTGWTVGGLALGLALAAPVLVAFVDFMSWGSTSYHEDVANNASYPVRQVMSLALPYAAGALNNPVMRLQAGYLTLPAVMMALVGLTGARRRGIRILLALTAVVLIGNMFGFTPIKVVLNHVPGIKAILVYKYGISILEFTVVIAAAIGIDDVAGRRVTRLRALLCAAATSIYTAVTVIVLAAQGYVTNLRWTSVALATLALVCVALLLILLRSCAPAHTTADGADGAAQHDEPSAGATRVASPLSLGACLAGSLLALSAVAHFAIPQAGASRPVAVDMAPVHYLQKHLGTSRFYTLGPIQPDYGSYWSLGQLNVNDLPVPKKYGEFVTRELTPRHTGLTPKQMKDAYKDYQLVPFNPPAAVERKLLAGYGEKQQAFRDAGVRYVVARPGVVSAESAHALGLHKVMTSRKAEIFADAAAQPYYTSDGVCRVSSASRTDVTLTCPKPATLTRRELAAPGWSATLNGRTQQVAAPDGQLYQRIDVPAGTTHITFDYRPKHFTIAVIMATLALLACLAVSVMGRRREHRANVQDDGAAVHPAGARDSAGDGEHFDPTRGSGETA